MNRKELLENGRAVLGLELGSTRIKAVLIDEEYQVIASGSYVWENQLIHGVWTYSLKEAWRGIQECYKELKSTVFDKYGVTLKSVKSMGVSGMMHGYLPFDKDGNQLSEFRTWRNTMTKQAVEELTPLFQFNIPQRWSIAHLYQAILKEEEHVEKIDFLTTLAGYVHWKLTGNKVIGIGEASGMFPIDPVRKQYNSEMIRQFSCLEKVKRYSWKPENILPKVLTAGENAGSLTREGALMLDPSGDLEEGIVFCPPEGDAGTGMVATNSVAVGTGNVSAGTSIFAMIVLKDNLTKVYEELDIVTTPAGDNVAMVHCNNCTTDLNAWVKLFGEFLQVMGLEASMDKIYERLFEISLKGEEDAGGLLSYNFYSGEHIAKVEEGRPLFVRRPDSDFTLANFMRNHLYSCIASLKIGLDILRKEENVIIDCIYGHGGLFKTKAVAQRYLSAAFQAPVAVMDTAAEGGPWGMAVLAAYRSEKGKQESLSEYLEKVFQNNSRIILEAAKEDIEGFEEYMKGYTKLLWTERGISEFF